MQKTANYQLNQWDTGDAVKRVDFNEDNAKIDAAIKTVEQTATQNVTSARQEAANALAAYQSSNDAAVTALQNMVNSERVVVDNYMGDGTDSRMIQLPFAPKFALILGQIHNANRIVLLLQGQDFYTYSGEWYSSPTYNTQMQGSTFVIQHKDYNNQTDATFYYVLFR